jgi:hypothetical protein
LEQLRVIECAVCTRAFVLCRRCYRGQKYCDEPCRRRARREQCRRAQDAYLQKLAGRRRRAEASAAYRARQRAGQRLAGARKVIAQALPRVRACTYSWPQEASCRRCGRPGWARGPRWWSR